MWHYVICDCDKKDAPSFCDSEYATMIMPDKVEHEIFAKYIFKHSFEKNQKKYQKIMWSHLCKNCSAKCCQTQDTCKVLFWTPVFWTWSDCLIAWLVLEHWLSDGDGLTVSETLVVCCLILTDDIWLLSDNQTTSSKAEWNEAPSYI